MLDERLTQQLVAVDGCEIAYTLTGSGAPVVLVHGLGGSRVLWEHVAMRLAPHARVLSYDLRAAGATREHEPAPLTLSRYASDLAGLLRALGVRDATLVGHSLGASIALKHALAAPEDVAGVVLVNADARLSRLAPRMERAMAGIRERGLSAWVDQVWSLNVPFAPESVRQRPEMVEAYRRMLLANDEADYVRTCQAVATCEDLTDQLDTLAVPALVLAGGADDRTRPEHGDDLAARLPRGELVRIDGGGHSLPLEAPEAVATAILQFMTDGRDGR